MSTDRNPEFIIIGAVKAATTWTSHNLGLNPSLFVPGPEPHYFSTEYDRGRAWYQTFFETAPKDVMIGEKSADYLAHPKAAKRIAADLPKTKLIVQLRNPVDRAYSDYCMLYRRGTVRQTPDIYFTQSTEHSDRFLTSGLYAKSLKRYFDHFPRENIQVFLYEDIKNTPEKTIKQVSNFLGVTAHIPSEGFKTRQNDGETAILPLGMRQALTPFKSIVAPLRGNAIFKKTRGMFARPPEYPPLDQQTHDFLTSFYAEDLKILGEMIHRDLSCWLTDANTLKETQT